jgi:Sulfotransferase domain
MTQHDLKDMTNQTTDCQQRRFLIVMGLPKSGTTYLYAQCQDLPNYFNMPAGNKEIDYFRRAGILKDYLTNFASTDDKVFVDSSPLYMDDLDATLEHMVPALEGQDVRIVVCLREPLDRAYSHYLHDVAQNFFIFGQSDYSIYNPSVLAKYLYPLAQRIRRLQEVFGKDRVHSFSFAGDNTGLETVLRRFARLPADWGFDYARNPAPGFTSPRVFYNPDRAITVSLREGLFTLPPGQFLIVNRQFSLLRRGLAPLIAEALLQNQGSINRVFDTTRLSDETRQIIKADYEEACALLGCEDLDSQPQEVFVSKESDSLPEAIASRLERIGTLDCSVANIYGTLMRGTDDAIIAMPEQDISLSQAMARLNLTVRKRDDGKQRLVDHLLHIVSNFGPAPNYMGSLMLQLARERRFDELEQIIGRYGSVGRLIHGIDLNALHDIMRPALTTVECDRLRALGFGIDPLNTPDIA